MREMNNKTYLYTYLFTLIAGVLLILLKDRSDIFTAISIVVGVLFLVIGVLTMIGNLKLSKAQKAAGMKSNPWQILASGASIILGLMMVIKPDLFVHLVVYALGVVLILCGIIQLANFLPQYRSLRFDWYFLIVPVLAIGFGVTVFVLGAAKIADLMALITGITLTVYSINGFLGYARRGSLARRVTNPGVPAEIV